jgi:hypothetical protein
LIAKSEGLMDKIKDTENRMAASVGNPVDDE